MSKKKNLKSEADSLFKAYPDKVKVFITSDGQGFWSENHASNHANKNKLEYQAFFRDGYEIEDKSGMEDLLITAEEKVRSYEASLNKIQDVANVDLEDAIEVDDEAHEAEKAVIELRLKYEEAVGNAADAVQKSKDYDALVQDLATLVKDDKTKLAGAIVKLLPVIPEA